MENKSNKKISFNRVLLLHISKLIGDGRPIMGMLIANEYLEQASNIRISLANMAKNVIYESSDYIYSEIFLNKILDDGYTFSKLSLKEQEIIITLNEKSFKKIENREIPKAQILDINKTRAKEGVEKLREAYVRNRLAKRIKYTSEPTFKIVSAVNS
ncbi:MAG: hypothetical protein ACOX3T_05125 [Bdellovibrionota bacterium]